MDSCPRETVTKYEHIIPTSSSFVIFLVLIVVLRFYMYPVVRNTNKVYPWAARKMLNLLYLCASIAAAARAAFLQNKRRSLPQQSLEQVTKVHFGSRPDIKRMLLEIDGENVGVMASRPPGLLEDVTTICSSGSASNLHFGSISFVL